jgi:hypothetical protein
MKEVTFVLPVRDWWLEARILAHGGEAVVVKDVERRCIRIVVR